MSAQRVEEKTDKGQLSHLLGFRPITVIQESLEKYAQENLPYHFGFIPVGPYTAK